MSSVTGQPIPCPPAGYQTCNTWFEGGARQVNHLVKCGPNGGTPGRQSAVSLGSMTGTRTAPSAARPTSPVGVWAAVSPGRTWSKNGAHWWAGGPEGAPAEHDRIPEIIRWWVHNLVAHPPACVVSAAWSAAS